jgi:hypothetical protein
VGRSSVPSGCGAADFVPTATCLTPTNHRTTVPRFRAPAQ